MSVNRHIALGLGAFVLALFVLHLHGSAFHPNGISPHWWVFSGLIGLIAWVWSQIKMTRDWRLAAVGIAMLVEILTNRTAIGAISQVLVDIFLLVALVEMIVERRSSHQPAAENASSRPAQQA